MIYIIEAANSEKVNLKDEYNVKVATVLGVIHVICGFIAFGAEIGGMFNAGTAGIWTIVSCLSQED